MRRETKKTGVAIFISDKIDFITKALLRDKVGCYTMIKRSIHQEDKTLVNIYAPKIGAPKYRKQMLIDINGEIVIQS